MSLIRTSIVAMCVLFSLGTNASDGSPEFLRSEPNLSSGTTTRQFSDKELNALPEQLVVENGSSPPEPKAHFYNRYFLGLVALGCFVIALVVTGIVVAVRFNDSGATKPEAAVDQVADTNTAKAAVDQVADGNPVLAVVNQGADTNTAKAAVNQGSDTKTGKAAVNQVAVTKKPEAAVNQVAAPKKTEADLEMQLSNLQETNKAEAERTPEFYVQIFDQFKEMKTALGKFTNSSRYAELVKKVRDFELLMVIERAVDKELPELRPLHGVKETFNNLRRAINIPGNLKTTLVEVMDGLVEEYDDLKNSSEVDQLRTILSKDEVSIEHAQEAFENALQTLRPFVADRKEQERQGFPEQGPKGLSASDQSMLELGMGMLNEFKRLEGFTTEIDRLKKEKTTLVEVVEGIVQWIEDENRLVNGQKLSNFPFMADMLTTLKDANVHIFSKWSAIQSADARLATVIAASK